MSLVLYSKLEPQINLDTQERINKALLEMVNNDDATVGLIEHTTQKLARTVLIQYHKPPIVYHC